MRDQDDGLRDARDQADRFSVRRGELSQAVSPACRGRVSRRVFGRAVARCTVTCSTARIAFFGRHSARSVRKLFVASSRSVFVHSYAASFPPIMLLGRGPHVCRSDSSLTPNVIGNVRNPAKRVLHTRFYIPPTPKHTGVFTWWS